MFGTIRRHQKWLWIVVSTVTIISFVAFFSPQQRRQGGWTGPRDQIGSINGKPITRDNYAHAYREAELRYVFTYGDWPDRDTSMRQSGLIEREAKNRLLLLNTIDQLGVRVGEPAMAEWIVDAFRDRTDKSFRKDSYQQFVSTVLPARGITKADFERFARHEVAIQHLAALAGTAGKLIPPQEAEAVFRRENEEVEAQAVFVTSSNFLAQVTEDPAAIAAYYTNHLANYRIPEKIQATYVKFANTNYLSEADQELAKSTNFNQYVETTYLQRGTNAFKDATGTVLSAEAAKQKIRDEARESFAAEEARKKAVEFANELFEAQDKTNALANLAAAKGLPSAVTEPFSQFESPPGLAVPPTFGQIASRLTPEEPYAEQPIVAEDGIYIIALHQRIPSQIPPLETVQDRVTQQYRNSKALELARAAGKELHAAVTNAIAQDKAFDVAVAEKNVSPVVLPPFSRKTTTLPGIPNPNEASQLVNTAFAVPPGQVSEFIPTSTGGFIVHVKNFIPVADERVKSELPEFTKTLRQGRQFDAFSEWFRKQMDTARVVGLPGERQQASAK
jgi:peptidyl-prolyl cis-trans isomerase D